MKASFNFDLKQVASFLSIINEGSFTNGARKLGIGQATISHHITQLEETLEVSLFQRSGKTIRITGEGKKFEDFCRKLFSDIEDLKENLIPGGSSETAVIAASTIPADYILPELISNLRKKNSRLFYKIEVSDSREAIEKVKEDSVDMGIVGQEINHPSIEKKRIFSDKIVLIGIPGETDRLKCEQLKDKNIIVRKKGSGTRKAWEKQLAEFSVHPSGLNIVYECSSTEGIKKAVTAGIGVAFISRMAVENELQLNTLKIIDIEGIEIVRDFYLIYRHKNYRSIPVNTLINSLEKRYFEKCLMD